MRLARTCRWSIFVIAASFMLASSANAESVRWNKTTNLLSYNYSSKSHFISSARAQLSVQYAIRVVNADTGEIFSSGVSVPAGTKVRFQFMPHQGEDIWWFITGYADDSPYGMWTDNAAPSTRICTDPTNEVSRDGGGICGIGICPLTTIAMMTYAVHPPMKHIEGTDSFSCTSEGADKRCELTTPGTYTIRFVFGETPGNLWSANALYQNCPAVLPQGYRDPSFPVAQQTIDFVLTVNNLPDEDDNPETPENPEAHTPSTPTLTAGAAACTLGTPHTITMTSTDPDNDQIRYGIDWNADGSIDQFMPGSGYVPSGTMQTASRTYSLAGSKTVKVLAQDSNGNSSGWATLSFTCADSATAGLNENDNQNTNTNQNNTSGPTAAVLDLRVIPSLVKSGNTTKVNWSASNVSSCNVSAPNGDAWSALQSAIGGNISKPITGQTTYTLKCLDLQNQTDTKTATVHILPTFQEI